MPALQISRKNLTYSGVGEFVTLVALSKANTLLKETGSCTERAAFVSHALQASRKSPTASAVGRFVALIVWSKANIILTSLRSCTEPAAFVSRTLGTGDDAPAAFVRLRSAVVAAGMDAAVGGRLASAIVLCRCPEWNDSVPIFELTVCQGRSGQIFAHDGGDGESESEEGVLGMLVEGALDGCRQRVRPTLRSQGCLKKFALHIFSFIFSTHVIQKGIATNRSRQCVQGKATMSNVVSQSVFVPSRLSHSKSCSYSQVDFLHCSPSSLNTLLERH